MKQLLILGLLLLAASACTPKMEVTVTNNSPLPLDNESVVVAWSDILNKLPEATDQNIVVCDAAGNQLPSQLLFEGGETPTGLLFQANLAPNQPQHYTLQTGVRNAYEPQVYGRFVPERKDDFAWENNKVAYRMYGPALEATGEISNGIDIWLKRTPALVVNKWYTTPGYDYHTDQGEGLDCYKVGRTLGAGANAPMAGDSLVLSNNFTSYRILDNGPLRISFELLYAPFPVNGVEVTQKRVVTLDAGQNLNTIATTYSGAFEQLDIASGIVIRNEAGEQVEQTPNAIAYTQPADSINGTTYLLVVTREGGESRRTTDHLLKPARVKNNETYTYRSGGYWSKYGITDQAAWQKAIQEESNRFTHTPELIIH